MEHSRPGGPKDRVLGYAHSSDGDFFVFQSMLPLMAADCVDQDAPVVVSLRNSKLSSSHILMGNIDAGNMVEREALAQAAEKAKANGKRVNKPELSASKKKALFKETQRREGGDSTVCILESVAGTVSALPIIGEDRSQGVPNSHIIGLVGGSLLAGFLAGSVLCRLRR